MTTPTPEEAAAAIARLAHDATFLVGPYDDKYIKVERKTAERMARDIHTLLAIIEAKDAALEPFAKVGLELRGGGYSAAINDVHDRHFEAAARAHALGGGKP